MRDSREAWSVCRQLAGSGIGKVYDKIVPAAKAITRQQRLEHFGSVWGAWVHEGTVVDNPFLVRVLLCSLSLSMSPAGLPYSKLLRPKLVFAPLLWERCLLSYGACCYKSAS